MKAVAIARSNLVRLFRDRSAIFFVFIFPVALILLIGLQFGGNVQPSVGLVNSSAGPVSEGIVSALSDEEGIELTIMSSEAELIDRVERGGIDAAVVIPNDFDQSVASGESAQVGITARAGGVGAALQPVIVQAINEATLAANAAGFVVAEGLGGFDQALSVANQIELPSSTVEVTTVGESLFPATLGQFDLGASSQLILFMFVTALSGSAVLIQTRELGLSKRMLSTPTSVRTIVAGEALGRFAVVLLQGLYIMAGALLIFGVDWGDPLGAAAILILFSAVGAGAAMLLGTLFRNAEQAGGVSIILGLGLAALGGSMLPLQLFSPGMQRIAHFTPHAWALDAFAKIRDEGGLLDIAPELSILAAYAVVLLLVASWRLRRVITRP